MTARILDGKAAAATVKDDLRARVKALGERGIVPGLIPVTRRQPADTVGLSRP